MKRYCLFFLLVAGCSSQVSSRTAANQNVLEEVRIALSDVRQAYSEQKMELQLLEEKITKTKATAQPSTKSLEARVYQLEKAQQKIQTDLHQLSSHANQTTTSLVQYRNSISALEKQIGIQAERLNEVVKLKSALNSISKAIGSGKIHKVTSGDSLEKIARHYNTSVDALKQLNGLTTNTIIIGQELKIPE